MSSGSASAWSSEPLQRTSVYKRCAFEQLISLKTKYMVAITQ